MGRALDLAKLRELLSACDAEAITVNAPQRAYAAEELSMELWRQRHALIAAASRGPSAGQPHARRRLNPRI